MALVHPSTRDRSWLKSLKLEARMAATDQGKRGIQNIELGEETMCRAFRSIGAAVMLGSSMFSLAEARAIELTGAWAGHADLCSQVFPTKEGRVMHEQFSDIVGSGL